MRIKLKTFRVSQNLNQEEIAEKIGCSRNGYNAIETGKRNGSMEFWQSLKDKFGLTAENLWELMKNE